MQPTLLCGLVLALLIPGRAQGGPDIEIEFEPMSVGPAFAGDDAPPEMLQGLLPFMPEQPGDSSHAAGSKAAREGELDNAIVGMLGSKQPEGGQQSAKWTDPDGSAGQFFIQGFPVVSKRSKMPVAVFHDLFPGPLMMEEEGADPRRGTPFGGPDPLILDMLQGMSQAFQQDLLPTVHRAGGTRVPTSCHADLMKHCSTERSQVHCLGRHQEDISEACRKDVGKSVPFVCSKSIDRYCDVLQTGILQCLGGHLKDLESQCIDAVIATRHVISKASTEKVSVKVKGSRNTPPPLSSSPGDTGFLSTATGPSQGVSDQKIFNSVADLIAEVNVASKHDARDREVRTFHREAFFIGLLIVASVYSCCLTDGSKRVYGALKPHMRADEDSKPLRSGVELPRPLAI